MIILKFNGAEGIIEFNLRQGEVNSIRFYQIFTGFGNDLAVLVNISSVSK